MAWYKRYGIAFQSRLGTQYMLYILEKTNGPLTRLTGAAEPFITEEADDTDIFTPMRGQTGTIRILDDSADGSLLSTLMPENNTQKQVCLYSGTWDNSFSTFTDGTLKWQGFLCAQAFTQPWDGGKKMIELPVKSLVAALEDITLPEAAAGVSISVARLFSNAFAALECVPSYVNMLTNIKGTWTSETFVSSFWDIILQSEVFYSDAQSNDEGQSTYSWEGMTYADAISAVLRLFGLMLREDYDELTLAMYDKTSDSSIHRMRYTWSYITGSQPGPVTEFWPAYNALLSALTFRGSDNSEGFTPGARRATVTLPVTDYRMHLNLPETAEDHSTVYDLVVDNPDVSVQPHQPRTNSIETFNFRKYAQITGQTTNPQTLLGTSDYAHCLQNSVIIHTTTWKNEDFITGAFPCRWYHTADGGTPILKNGLFLNQRYVYSSSSTNHQGPCYTLRSSLSYTLSDGYLQIRLNNYNFDQGSGYNYGQTPATPHFGRRTVNPQLYYPTKLYVIIRLGDKYWRASTGQWESYGNSAEYMPLEFTNDGQASNYSADMHITETEGYFIPVGQEMSGQLWVYISDLARIELEDSLGNLGFRMVHSRIISDLAVQFVARQNATASDRNENSYRRTILESGFQAEQSIGLTVGTMNNNKRSPAFIKDSGGSFIESITFMDASRAAAPQRPELNLLDRMAAHYATVRRTYRVKVQSGLWLTNTMYSMDGRHYFGVDARHDWREDEQEIKFIEVQ